MKKVKLMLVSLSVLAVVGAALAFNAKGATTYCTATPVGGSCANLACAATITAAVGVAPDPFYCTTPTSGVSSRPCKDASQVNLPCGASVRLAVD